MKKSAAGVLFRQITLVFCVLSIAQSQSAVSAQSLPIELNQAVQANPPISVLSTAQLDSLVSPIALYPDPLLSQVLVAATYPLEIVEAAQWLQQNPTLAGPALQDSARQQNWDPSIQALVAFPDVLSRLGENIRWTTDLGNAFLAQETGVMDAVQRMRRQAMASGTLMPTPETLVTTQTQGNATIVEIEPSNPQVIYVPYYDPLAIWGPAAYYPYPALRYSRGSIIVGRAPLSFASGVFIGSLFPGWGGGWGSWGWRPNWFGHTVVVNNNFFNRYGYNRYSVGNRLNNGTAIWRNDTVRRQSLPSYSYSNRRAPARYENHFARPVPSRPQSTFRSGLPAGAPGVSRSQNGFRSQRPTTLHSPPSHSERNRGAVRGPGGVNHPPAQNFRNSPTVAPQRPPARGQAPQAGHASGEHSASRRGSRR